MVARAADLAAVGLGVAKAVAAREEAREGVESGERG